LGETTKRGGGGFKKKGGWGGRVITNGKGLILSMEVLVKPTKKFSPSPGCSQNGLQARAKRKKGGQDPWVGSGVGFDYLNEGTKSRDPGTEGPEREKTQEKSAGGKLSKGGHIQCGGRKSQLTIRGENG